MDAWGDDWLMTAIQGALVNESGMEGTHVEVESRDGVVTLRGVVHTSAQRERAASVVRNFGGVAGVRNEILVTP